MPRLVVLRALGLGDLLTAVPALRALAAAFPDHERVLAAPRSLQPLVELIPGAEGRPAVDDVVHARELERLDASLNASDVAVNLHGRGPESHRIVLAAEPHRLIAFRHHAVPETAALPEWRPREHEVVRWCRLLTECGMPADPTRLGISAPAVAPPRWVLGATVLHPGAASAARRWPADRWAEVARAEAGRGRPVVITGSAREAAAARRIAAAADLPARAVVAGRTDLRDLAAVVAGAARLASGDTGVAHLATALGTPSVLLFGPTSPAEWGPPADQARHRVLWAGRLGDPHAPRPDPGLLEIGVDDVVAALEDLPGAQTARAA